MVTGTSVLRADVALPRQEQRIALPLDEHIEKKEEEKSILGAYGWYPLIGLGAVTIFSKEIIIYNADFMMAVDISLISFLVWINFGDQIAQDYKDWVGEYRKHIADTNETYVYGLKDLSSTFSSRAVWRDFVEEAAAHDEKSTRAYIAYQNLKLRSDARNAVLAKLQTAKLAKAATQLKARRDFIEGLEPYVSSRYAKDATLRAQEVDNAIARLSKPVDPAKDTFASVLREYAKGAKQKK